MGRQGEVGEAYSLITRNMAALVPSLVQLLKSCGQVVEPNLLALAEDTELFREKDEPGGGGGCSDGEGDDGDEE